MNAPRDEYEAPRGVASNARAHVVAVETDRGRTGATRPAASACAHAAATAAMTVVIRELPGEPDVRFQTSPVWLTAHAGISTFLAK